MKIVISIILWLVLSFLIYYFIFSNFDEQFAGKLVTVLVAINSVLFGTYIGKLFKEK